MIADEFERRIYEAEQEDRERLEKTSLRPLHELTALRDRHRAEGAAMLAARIDDVIAIKFQREREALARSKAENAR